MKTKKTIYPMLFACLPAAAFAQDRPNILWLTFEDTSWYELGCYGNDAATTPLIDSLAKVGVQFMNAYSCGSQSSPSRSTLITGCYATTYGMDWHRSRVGTPTDIFFPQYLRDAGYYCTNNHKTDYNTAVDNNSFWDECSNTATYNSPKRGKDQPFFAVFNSFLTHMSRITSGHIDGRRDFSLEGMTPETMPLPPHVPNLPEVFSDYAFHVEGVNDVDKWVGLFFKDLEEKGLADNTIVFIFSDHGGCLPRGKAFSYETTFKVPFVAYFPEKWKHLANTEIGKPTDRLINFSDMGPTVLSLAGVKVPDYMQGTPFFGTQDKGPREWNYAYMTNRTIHFAPARTITDGHYKYVRFYIPYKKDDLYNYFQWQMPANLYWEKAYYEGKLDEVHRRPFESTPAEAFFDVKNDPYEINNLADDPAYAELKAQYSAELSKMLRQTHDIGLIPVTNRNGDCLVDRINNGDYDIEIMYKLAEMTLNVSEKDLPYLKEIALSEKPKEFKFWATVNLSILARQGKLKDTSVLQKLLEEDDNSIQQEAAAALCFTKDIKKGFDFLLTKPSETIALEMLSLDPVIKKKFPKSIINMLRKESDKYEAKDFKAMPTGMNGLNQRKVLVNLGLIGATELYGDKVYEAGLKVNQTRRPLVPSPEAKKK